jgi:hypothetical protein
MEIGANGALPGTHDYNYLPTNRNTTMHTSSTSMTTSTPSTNTRLSSQQYTNMNTTPYQQINIANTEDLPQTQHPPDGLPISSPYTFLSTNQHPSLHHFSSTNPLSIDTLLRHSGEHTISQDDLGAFVNSSSLSTCHSASTTLPINDISDITHTN